MPDGIDTPSNDFNNINTTNFNRNPQVKSLIPRTPKGKQNPSKFASNKPRYNGPVYLPKQIYNMLKEEVKKELDKYNQENMVDYQPNSNRMTKVHKQDHGDEGPPNHPEPDLGNYHAEDSYPMQDSDNEELIDSHGGYSVKMASSYHICNYSPSFYGCLVDRGANGGLAGAVVHILERTGRKCLSLALMTMN